MKIPANEDDSPVIDPGKKDTKTNIMVVIGVAVFLVLTGLLMWFYAANPDDLGDDVHEEYAEPGPQR